jgi:hypothetical protein
LVDAHACGDASADQVVEQAGVDRFVRAAAGEPHPDLGVLAGNAIDVRRPRAHAEPAGGAALESERGRGIEGRRDGVQLVAPRRQFSFVTQRSGDVGDRRRARRRVDELGIERDTGRLDAKHSSIFRELLGTHIVEPADGIAVHDQRTIVDARRRQRCGEPRVDCR